MKDTWQLEEADFYHAWFHYTLVEQLNLQLSQRLILAKFKKFHIQSHRASLISAPKIQQQDQTLLPQSCLSFCYGQLVPTLKDITNRSYREQYLNEAHFEITEIDKNIGLKLAVT